MSCPICGESYIDEGYADIYGFASACREIVDWFENPSEPGFQEASRAIETVKELIAKSNRLFPVNSNVISPLNENKEGGE